MEHISMREIHRSHIPFGLEGFHVFRTKHFSEQDLQSSSFPAGFLRKILLPTQISAAQEWNGWISMFLLPGGVLLS